MVVVKTRGTIRRLLDSFCQLNLADCLSKKGERMPDQKGFCESNSQLA